MRTFKSDRSLFWLVPVFVGLLLLFLGKNMPQTFAETSSPAPSAEHFVTITDHFSDRAVSKRTVKTDAATVAELFARLGLSVDASDQVSPSLDTPLDTPDIFISIHRSFPVLIIDGAVRKVTTATSYDPSLAVLSAGFTLYDTDSVSRVHLDSFLETGVVTVYQITRGEDYRLAALAKSHSTAPLASDFKAELVASLDVPRLTARMGRNRYVGHNLSGELVERQETYYDLPMSGVMGFCGQSSYTVREDGAKVDPDGYILVAAALDRYPRCSVVETSLGLGKVYDTGTFAASNPEQFDLATDWTNHNGA